MLDSTGHQGLSFRESYSRLLLGPVHRARRGIRMNGYEVGAGS